MRTLSFIGAATLALSLFLPVQAKSEPTIRFATLTSISKAPPGLVAEAKGLFKKHGVNVEMKLFPSGAAAIEALAAGQFDIGMFGDIPSLALLGQGYPGKIIAAGLGGPKRQAVLVPLDSKDSKLEDLKGKRIGLSKGSTDEIALEATMKKVGMTWSDFTVVNLRPPEKPTLLQTRQVDAIEAWEPVPSIIVVKGIGKRILTADGDIDDIVGITVASKKILEEQPEAVVNFLKALHEGAEYAQNNPNEMVDFLSQKLNMERAVAIDSIPSQWWYIEFYKDTHANWRTAAAIVHKLGRVKEPIKIEDHIDTTFLAKALGKKYPLEVSAPQAMKYPVVTVKN